MASGSYATLPLLGESFPSIQKTTGISFSLWGIMRPDSIAYAVFMDFSVGTSATSRTEWFSLYKGASGRNLRFYISGNLWVYPFAIDDGLWHHVVWSLSSAGSWTVFVDNVKYVCSSCTTAITLNMPTAHASPSTYWNYLGKDETSVNINGNMDDFRVYKFVLSDSQVDTLYKGRSMSTVALPAGPASYDFGYPVVKNNITGVPLKPFLWYKFDTDDCFADSSGNGYHAKSPYASPCTTSSPKMGTGSMEFKMEASRQRNLWLPAFNPLIPNIQLASTHICSTLSGKHQNAPRA
jgi:hypothetical protein